MTNNLLILLALATGAGLAVQAVVNARLRISLGSPVWAAIVQVIVGLAFLTALAAVSRPPAPALGAAVRAPWWIWTGGIFGSIFVLVSILLTPRLGVALMLAAIVVGQLLAALAIDHYGWLGAPTIRISVWRLVGAALLVAGVILIRRSG